MRLPFFHLERVHEPGHSCTRPLVELVLEEHRSDGQPLGDFIAPAAISIQPDHVILDRQFARALALVGLPPVVDIGWLEPLVASTLPSEVALYVSPADVGRVAVRLARRHVRLMSSQLSDAFDGRLADPEIAAGKDEIANLRDALARGTELPFEFALYVLVRARSRAELDRLTRAAQDVLAALSGRLAIARLQQEAGLHACLPEGSDALGVRHLLETSSLVTAYPFPPAGLVVRLPLAPLSVIGCFTHGGQASAYRHLRSLLDRGLVNALVNPWRTSGRPARLLSTTRLGLDMLARSRGIDPHVLVRSSATERVRGHRLMAELGGRLAAYELLGLVAVTHPGEVTLVNWERPWCREMGAATAPTGQAARVIRFPAAATLGWASAEGTLASEYLLVPDTGGLAIPALRATLSRLAEYQSDAPQSRSTFVIIATMTARRATAWTRLVESASTGRGLPRFAYKVRIWDNLRRTAEVRLEAPVQFAGVPGARMR
jgi:hypothetical protein